MCDCFQIILAVQVILLISLLGSSFFPAFAGRKPRTFDTLGMLHGRLASQRNYLITLGHELHHGFYTGPWGANSSLSTALPAGFGVSATDAYGFLYLVEAIRDRNFGSCAPPHELYADRAAETLLKTILPSESYDGVYWVGCSQQPTSADRKVFESIAKGDIPEHLYTTFRGNDGVWQRSEINNFWKWIVDNSFGAQGFGTDKARRSLSWVSIQGFNDSSFIGREYYDST